MLFKYDFQGVTWEHIPSDQALTGISCGPDGQVWAVGKNGSSYWRFGINPENPIGIFYYSVKKTFILNMKYY